MKTILLTGSYGQLGVVCEEYLNKHFKVYSTARTAKNKRFLLDISSRQSVKRVLENVQPDIILNLAAMTDVDRCESEPGIAKKYNLNGLINLFAAGPPLHTIFILWTSTQRPSPWPSDPTTNRQSQIIVNTCFSVANSVFSVASWSIFCVTRGVDLEVFLFSFCEDAGTTKFIFGFWSSIEDTITLPKTSGIRFKLISKRRTSRKLFIFVYEALFGRLISVTINVGDGNILIFISPFIVISLPVCFLTKSTIRELY